MKDNLFKRLLIGTCTACTLLLGSIPVMAAEYPDVSTGAWYYSYVQDVSDKGLMSGYNDGRFGSNDKLTRGQFATVLWRMNGSPDMGNSSFSDVPATSFYAKASEWARVNGVITGYSDGRFGGNDNINREQVATILYRYSDGEANGNIWEYPDGNSVSTFARDGMAYAVGNGIISGDNGYLNPQGDVVRAVAATMISRFYSDNNAQNNNQSSGNSGSHSSGNNSSAGTTDSGHSNSQPAETTPAPAPTPEPTPAPQPEPKPEPKPEPAPHVHTPVHQDAVYKTVSNNDGWTEYIDHTYCNGCGKVFNDALTCADHAGFECQSGYHTRTETIEHPATTRQELVSEAYDYCSECGAKL